MNIKETLEYGIEVLKKEKVSEPILKTKIILANTLNKPKEYLLIHEKELVDEKHFKMFDESLSKLSKGVPIQYIINKQEFMGMDFFVDENVLIPQPDTEILVEEVLRIIKNMDKPTVLDLCTGSGAIGIAIKKNIKGSEVTLSDISENALNIAKINAKKNEVDIKLICSDLFSNINEKYNIIVSNPPYIKTEVIKTLSKEVQKEPKLALDGGQDGLAFYRKIIDEAYKFLKKDGYLCLEIGYDQKNEVMDLIKKSKHYKGMYSKKDLSGNDRIVICKI